MDLLCGCFSGRKKKYKKYVSEEKQPESQQKTRGKGKKRNEDKFQNGGGPKDSTPEEANATSEAAAAQDTGKGNDDRSPPADVTSTTGSNVTTEAELLARPRTIVGDDVLISEIESALEFGGKANPSPKQEESTNETEGNLSDDISPTPLSESSPPDTTTTIENDERDEPSDTPPTHNLPPQPSTPETTTTTAKDEKDKAEESSDDSPPTLPPRMAQSSSSGAAHATEADSKPPEGSEDVPPPRPPPITRNTAKLMGDDAIKYLGKPPPLMPRRFSTTATVSSTSKPPPKPRRSSVDGASLGDREVAQPAKRQSFRKPPPLPGDWAIIELPKTDAELLKQTQQPEQLAAMTESYIVNHVNLHTDVRITTDLQAQIHSAFLTVAKQKRAILQRFLTDLIEDQSNSSADDGQPPEPSHGTVVALLKEILRQFEKPESLVLITLELLRAQSHISGASQTLVDCEITSILLRTMSAHKSAATVQQYCLEVLAIIAKYPPQVQQQFQTPLDQCATDLIDLALETHLKSVAIAKAACQALRNLTTTLYTAANNIIENKKKASDDEVTFMTGLMSFLDYVLNKSSPPVRSAIKCHGDDLNVINNGSQFLLICAKMEHLRQRKNKWTANSGSQQAPPPIPAKPIETPARGETHQSGSQEPNSQFYHTVEYENWDLLRGVLQKKSSLNKHRYSKGDLQFMQNLTKTQVVALVCALAVDSHVNEALKLLDEPVIKVVQAAEVPPGVRDFVSNHNSPTDTLIDLDPGLFVSLIDAVRYPSLSFQMAQKCVLEVVSALNGEQQVPVVAVTVEFLAATITNRPLGPAMTVPEFVTNVCEQLERAKNVSQNSSVLDSLLSEIKLCARKTGEYK